MQKFRVTNRQITILLIINSLVLVGFGLVALINPEGLASQAGIRLDTPDATADFRAVYGGLQVSLGLFLIWCVRAKQYASGLVAATLILAGLSLGRLTGMAASGAWTPTAFWLLAPELVGVAVNLSFLLLERRR